VIGQTISHYRIVEKLGEGGMGVVYKAEDAKLDRAVALKFLGPHLGSSEEGRARFVREARAAAAIDHPNICTVYEVDEFENQIFIAMAFIEGQSLGRLIRQGPLQIEDALETAMQVADGLAAAHRKGVVHRDVKPGNILITTAGSGRPQQAKILDFGVAQLAGEPRITKTESAIGTLAYMAPEQAVGKPVDQRVDIWALGVVLYEMVAGELPFEGRYQPAIVYAIMNEEPEPLTAVREGAPAELERIVNKALEKDPAERYQQIDEMLADLRALRRKPEPPVKTSPSRRGAASYRWYAAGLTVLGALGIFLVWLLHTTPVEPPVFLPLTSYPGAEGQPSFSPDGKQVAFAWNGEQRDNFDIYVKAIGSEPPLRLTDGPLDETSPAWSPDGSRVAFTRIKPAGGAVVALISPLGGAERELAEIAAPTSPFYPPALNWSPDGDFLAAEDRDQADGPVGIFVISVNNGQKSRLTTPPPVARFGDLQPTFSPDGSMVAFQRYLDWRKLDICVVSVDGGPVRTITSLVEEPFGLAWSSDGRELLYAQRPQGLFLINVASGSRRQVPGFAEEFHNPTVDRGGSKIAVAKAMWDTDIWRLDLQRDGGQLERFVSSTRPEGRPAYSPDGRKIALMSYRSGRNQIWVFDADGANPLQLTNMEWAGASSWSPDSRTIAFAGVRGDQSGIYAVNSSGGDVRLITRRATSNSATSWSSDGRWIYFSSAASGDPQIWKASAQGESQDVPAVQVTSQGGVEPRSRQGDYIYYAKRRYPPTEIWRFSEKDGNEEFVAGPFEAFGWHFAVGVHGVYVVDRDGSGGRNVAQLKLFRFDSLQTERLAQLNYRVQVKDPGLTVSPDGRWVLGAQTILDSDLMLVENFK
jgi:eukaryotic-like serine/threonine-protein kinase